MTNTTLGKKLLLIATITVLVSGLTIATSLSDANADPKAKKEHPPTGTHDLKCKKSIGSFFDPDVSKNSDTGDLLISTSEGKCNFLGHTASSSITTVTGFDLGTGCVTLETPLGVDSYAIGKKGFFTFEMTLEQCFFDEDGLPTLSALSDLYCGASTDAFTSTVTGTYTITGGELIDKKHGNTSIDAGTGTITSSVDHCAGSTAPYGNSVVTEMTGEIVFPTIP
jgi:hypothetical protein